MTTPLDNPGSIIDTLLEEKPVSVTEDGDHEKFAHYVEKEKIVERHKVLKRQKRKNKIRYCQGNCGTVLSVYNDSKYCDHCLIDFKLVEKKMKEIKGFMEKKNETEQ